MYFGADQRNPGGTKELIAITDGYRESEQSWRELLLDVRDRGLTIDPDLAIGDGGLGFWGAVRKVFPKTREQRCWVHKTANVLNKLPKGVPSFCAGLRLDVDDDDLLPAASAAPARLMARVVFPAPPFWERIEIVFMITRHTCNYYTNHSMK